MINHRSNCRIGKIGCYHIHIALYWLSSRVGDKRTRTADIRHRVLSWNPILTKDSCGSGGSSYRRTRNGGSTNYAVPYEWVTGRLTTPSTVTFDISHEATN
ncbi:hypothetical protein ACOSQ4_032200 [Xanthoceras sorbifolium]